MGFIVVSGLRDLAKNLREVSKTMPKEIAAINGRMAGYVAREAQSEAPRGPHEGGGRIISIAASIKTVQSATYAGVKAGGKRAPHAAPTEFGGTIPRRGHKGQSGRRRAFRGAPGGRTRIKKRPFLYPALDRMRPRIIAEYEAMLDEAVQRMAAGNATTEDT